MRLKWNLKIERRIQVIKHLIAFVFLIIYCLISLPNHYYFRTYALDYGLFNQSIAAYAHFDNSTYSIANYGVNCALGDHFSLIQFLYVPFYWILGSYALLVIQILSIIIGGYGVYKFAEIKFKNNKWLPSLFMLQFYGTWGIVSALSFDYHDNVIAAMLLPWFFVFFYQEKWAKMALIYTLIIFCKENMPLWMAFVCLGLITIIWKNKQQRKIALLLSIISFVYFILVIKVLIPLNKSDNAGYHHFGQYDFFTKITFQSFCSRPLQYIKLIFTNHLFHPYYKHQKEETLFMFLMAGGALFILKPQYAFMLLPIFGQKFLTGDFIKWGINAHYSIEFVPILTLGVIDVLSSYQFLSRVKTIVAISILVCTYGSHIYVFEKRDSHWFKFLNIHFYKQNHYQTSLNKNSIYKAISLIPQNAKVCTNSVITTHMPYIRSLYCYPFKNDTNCFLFLKKPEDYYLYSPEQLQNEITRLENDKQWTKIFDENDVCLFVQNTLLH